MPRNVAISAPLEHGIAETKGGAAGDSEETASLRQRPMRRFDPTKIGRSFIAVKRPDRLEW